MDGLKPIKVLIVAPAPPLIGGQTVQARKLIEKFRSEPGIEAALLPINPSFLPLLQRIKYLRTILTSFRFVIGLLATIPRYDVVHIFSASYFSFLLAPFPSLLAAKLFGKKTILNYRSGEAEDHLSRWRSALPIIKRFDRVVVPSGYLVEVFAKFGIVAESVFNFVDKDKYQFRERHPLRPIFLSNRNFEKLYNVGLVLEAFAKIREKHLDAKLILAGDGEEKGSLRTRAEELGLENVEFVGRISPEAMPRLLNRADIYLSSPNIDNMPNSIIEAFAAGLPVVSTNAGGIPYICDDGRTALLVETGDAEGIAAKALRLLEDGELARKMIAEAHRECQKYSWENVREDWLRIYKELAR